MWRFPILAGAAIAALALTSAPFAHDSVRAKAIAAAIIMVPFAALALWLARRKTAGRAKPQPASRYAGPFGGQR
jgi:hypothetical protein